jgi:hypothetical protein
LMKELELRQLDRSTPGNIAAPKATRHIAQIRSADHPLTPAALPFHDFVSSEAWGAPRRELVRSSTARLCVGSYAGRDVYEMTTPIPASLRLSFLPHLIDARCWAGIAGAAALSGSGVDRALVERHLTGRGDSFVAPG